jgi:hypothetical protein
MCYMVDPPAIPRREYVPVRLSVSGLDRIREMAAQETEGNVSQMIRKLLAEAIQHRDAKKAPGGAS